MQQQSCIVYACLVCFLYNFVTGGSNMDCLDYWRELYIMFMKETFVMGTLGALSCYSCGWMKRLRIGVEVKGTSDGWHLVTSDKWGLGPGDWGLGDLYKHYTDITHGHSGHNRAGPVLPSSPKTPGLSPQSSPPPVLCIQLSTVCRQSTGNKT